jgi:hypothetical protein
MGCIKEFWVIHDVDSDTYIASGNTETGEYTTTVNINAANKYKTYEAVQQNAFVGNFIFFKIEVTNTGHIISQEEINCKI